MTGSTSGTYFFSPSNAEVGVESFSRIGREPPTILREHWFEFRRSLNFELLSWSNRGINLWAVDQQTIPIIAGQGVYVGSAEGVPAETVAVTEMWFSQVNGIGPGVNNDRIMLPMSRDEYAEYPNKLQQGTPTRYWFERVIPPQVTIWQTPQTGQDSTLTVNPYVINYYRLRRLQDANPAMAQTPDVEYRFLDALCAGVAMRLSLKYEPTRFAMLKTEAKEAWELAAMANRDDAPIRMAPNVAPYWRV